MHADLQVPGFEGRGLQVEISATGSAQLFLDGAPAPEGGKRGEFALKRNDGAIVMARFAGFFLDPFAKLEVGGEPYRVLEPLPWYQWMWAGLPAALVLMGGMVGGALGAAALFVNGRVLRSSLPGPIRGLLSGAVTAAALLACLGVAALLHRHPSAPGTTQGTVPGAGRAMVHVDNDAGDERELWIDGTKWGAIRPWTIEAIDLPAGTHRFSFRKGGQEEDLIEADLPALRIVTLNPGGKSAYSLEEVTYTTGIPFNINGPPPSSTDVRGQKAVVSDFGLLNAFPGMIQIETGPHLLPQEAVVRTATRTKLVKVAAGKELPLGRAMLAARTPAAWSQADLAAAFAELGRNAADGAVREALLASAEATDNEAVVSGALDALRAGTVVVPDDRLVKWLTGDRPALVQAATRLAMRRDDGALLRAHFAGLKLESQQHVLIATFEGLKPAEKPSADLRRSLLGAALRSWPEDKATTLTHQVEDKDLSLDDDFIRQVDQFVAGLKNEQNRRLWNSVWGRRLCGDAPGMKGDAIDLRLISMVEDPHPQTQIDIKGDAIRALVLRDRGDRVAALLSKFERSLRWRAIETLRERCQAEKAISDAGAALALEVLKDPEVDLREASFQLLSRFALEKHGTQEALRAALLAEQNEQARSNMEQELSRVVAPSIEAMSPAQLVQAIAASPTREVTGRALKRLVHDEKRLENLDLLAAELPRMTSVAARVWVFQELCGLATWLSNSVKDACPRLTAIGLADKDPAVRAAAVRARTETLDLSSATPDPAVVFGEAYTEARKAELSLELDRAVAERCALLVRGDHFNTPKRAVEKLREFASAPDDQAAITAIDALGPVYDDPTVDLLRKVFEGGVSEARKVAILRAVGVNNDAAFEGVLPVYEKGLSDANGSVRRAAFDAVVKWCASDNRRKRVLAAARDCAGREADAEAKKKMDEWIRRAERK